MAYDTLISGGHVIDPANGVNCVADVAIKDGKIHQVASPGTLMATHAVTRFDATGLLVVPGLIDTHVHVLTDATPLGITADKYCLARGCTTVVDLGSAGSENMDAMSRTAAEMRTRILAFCHVSAHGLAPTGGGNNQGAQPDGRYNPKADSTGGELYDIGALDVDRTVSAIRRYDPLVVGAKVRLSSMLTSDSDDPAAIESEAFDRALDVAGQAGVPLAVHHANSTVDLNRCPGQLRPGDIYTHCFSAGEREGMDLHGTITLDGEMIHPAVLAARDRGVIFDVGHGNGAFSWTVAEVAAKHEFWPDVISTDLHAACIHGPAYDMPTTLTKFLMLGMPLPDVIRAATHSAARSIGWGDRIGTLGEGRCADIAVLELLPCDEQLDDSFGQLRHCTERVVTRAVWRAGEMVTATQEQVWPNPESAAEKYAIWSTLKIRDAVPPPSPLPEVLQALHERQEQYAFLAQAMARYGGDACSQNLPLYISPARLGHLSKKWGGGWAVLPFCAQPIDASRTLGVVVSEDSESKGQAVVVVDNDDGEAHQVTVARRQLIAFASTAEEQERLRRALYASCC